MELKLSNAMRLARGEIQSTRAAAATVRAEANELASRHREGELVSLEEVHAAEGRADAAEARYGAARRRFETKRADYAPKFREQQASASAELREGLSEVADHLERVIESPRAIDAFAVSHALPTTLVIGRSRRLAALAREFREIANL